MSLQPSSRGFGAALLFTATVSALVFPQCSDDDADNTAPPAPAPPATSNDSGNLTCPSPTANPPPEAGADSNAPVNDEVKATASALIDEGRQTFRFDTFGDEDFWGGVLKLHQAVQGSAHGGVGDGVSPKTALAVGLKVDVDALPAEVVEALKGGTANLDNPDTTLALLRANAVIGVTGNFDVEEKNLTSIGIQCAFCHSTVDDSLTEGIGHRLDGWANRDLNVGAIVNLSPDLSAVAAVLGVPEATVRTVLQSWGPGKFDAELFLDGKAFRPDTKSGATLIPPAFGLVGVNLHTWTGWGSVTYWNAFVANLEMHGKGNFFDPRLDDATKFPVANNAKNGHTTIAPAEDRITPKLAGLHFYQMALVAPAPKAGSFNATAAERGKSVFEGQAKCASCHVPPLFTEPGWNMHTPAEIGIDDFQSSRSPDLRYRTSPLKGLATHAKGGFYHDGRFATLLDVVNHYDAAHSLALTTDQKNDLVEYLKSL